MSWNQHIVTKITRELVAIISETNGINLEDTIDLLSHSPGIRDNNLINKQIQEFKKLLSDFHQNEININKLLDHSVSDAFFSFFKNFPIRYQEEHIHLTGSLSAGFIYPRLRKLLESEHKDIYKEKICEVYGEESWPIESVEDVDKLIRLKEGEQFMTYLKILYLAKLILIDRKAHEEAAYHMAEELYEKYNIGHIRLKFTLNRSTNKKSEQLLRIESITEEDVIFGLYDGFKKFQSKHSDFDFILSPCFRKEAEFYDKENYNSKEEHFLDQVNKLLKIVEKNPKLKKTFIRS